MAENNIFDKGQTTFQADRILSAIDPETVKLDGRSFYDLADQSFRFAKTINFFNTDDEIDGTWASLFNDITVTTPDGPMIDRDKVDRMMCSGETPPPLAMLLTFIKLFSIEQDNMNLLTRRHLEFYYHDILHMTKRKGTAGNVPVRMELEKRYDNVFIPKGTGFLAGKDSDGKDIRYRSVYDYSLTRAKVTDTLAFRKSSLSYEIGDISQSPYRGFGFAISSPLFEFDYGEIHLRFPEANAALHSIFKRLVNIHYTSDKGWVTVSAKKINVVQGSSSGSLDAMVGASILIDRYLEDVALKIEESSPVARYDADIHGGSFNAKNPVFIFDFGNSTDTLRNCKSANGFRLGEITLSSYDRFTMEGEFGTLQNKVGVKPFGNEPLKGASFKIKSPLIRYVSNEAMIGRMDYSACSKCKLEDTWTFTNNEDFDFKGYANKLLDAIRNETPLPTKPEAPSILEPYCLKNVLLKCGDNDNMYFTVSPYGEAGSSCNNALMDFSGMMVGSQDDGYYLGVSDAMPGTAISCYFDINPKKDCTVQDTKIRILSNNAFCEDVEILTDSTKGLTRSGVISFKLPSSNDPGTIMPKDRKWLYVPCCSNTINQVYSQVIELEPDPESPGKVPVGIALPAGSVSKVENKIKGLKSVYHEVEGDKGRSDETDVQFYTRVSELLRHKNRAYSMWDYERLILENFPQVAGVNCRRATKTDEPGAICVNVIPGMEARQDPDTLDETFPNSTLNDIKEFLQEHASPFARIHVNNPRYERVHINVEVSLRKDYIGNDQYYKDKINKAIIEFLTPWKNDDKFNTLTTNRFNISKITYMLEGLEYIDHVHGISANYKKEIKDGYVNADESDNLLTILISDSDNTITIK